VPPLLAQFPFWQSWLFVHEPPSAVLPTQLPPPSQMRFDPHDAPSDTFDWLQTGVPVVQLYVPGAQVEPQLVPTWVPQDPPAEPALPPVPAPAVPPPPAPPVPLVPAVAPALPPVPAWPPLPAVPANPPTPPVPAKPPVPLVPAVAPALPPVPPLPTPPAVPPVPVSARPAVPP
jgi:hypothetical protein